MKKRFTIIELLVVISVIGILLTMLMPGIRKTRLVTIQSVCASNLKQSGYAGAMYADENSTLLVNEWDGWNGAVFYNTGNYSMTRFGSHQVELSAYANKEVFICPSGTRASAGRNKAEKFRVDYGMPIDYWGKSLVAFENPAESGLNTDTIWHWINHNTANRIEARHMDKANILYVDGHVTSKQRRILNNAPALFMPFQTWNTVGNWVSSGFVRYPGDNQ
jgi:prepilin-type processing-associated H-X9-DG protein